MTKIRDIAPFGVRLPDDLKERIRQAARSNKRSMNAEILYRVESGLEPDIVLADFSDAELITELMRRYGRGEIYIRVGKEED